MLVEICSVQKNYFSVDQSHTAAFPALTLSNSQARLKKSKEPIRTVPWERMGLET